MCLRLFCCYRNQNQRSRRQLSRQSQSAINSLWNQWSKALLWNQPLSHKPPFRQRQSTETVSSLKFSVYITLPKLLRWLFNFFFILAEELIPKHGRPARPASVPAPEIKGERVDSGSQFSTPGKGVRSIKDKLMTRPRNRSRADYDALAQVKFLVSGKAILLLYIFLPDW